MANLQSVLILGADAVAAAAPATPVQLVHACHRWGFSAVVPASWGDELLAGEVIRRCGIRENRPAIQCSCPRVAERLGQNASKIEDSIFWLATPPVAAASYIRAHAAGSDVHITYAGACPGANDAIIDQRISPTELLLTLSARGIDIGAQPTVFENIVPPDRRRHFSMPAGSPDPQRLWESTAFRVAQPADTDVVAGIAQLLLGDERVLIDMGASVGCICRATPKADADPMSALRSPSPVVHDGVIEVGRSAPAMRTAAHPPPEPREPLRAETTPVAPPESPRPSYARRQSPAKPVFRRYTAWRRQTPRPGSIARTSAVFVSIPDETPLLQRPRVRAAVATALALGTLMLGLWIGRLTAPAAAATAAEENAPPTQSLRSRSP